MWISEMVIFPMMILISAAFGVFVFARAFKLPNKVISIFSAFLLVAFIISLINLLNSFSQIKSFNTSGMVTDGKIIYDFSVVGAYVLITAAVSSILIFIYSGEYLSKDHRFYLFYPLVLLALSSLIGMFFTDDLFHLLLLSELTTIAASSLIAFRFENEDSVWAGFKYLVMNSIALMMMLLGVYFYFRSNGQLSIQSIQNTSDLFSRISAGCFLLGFSLKTGIVPLHTWIPDVYSNAPSVVGGLLSGVVSKSVLFIFPPICIGLGLTSVEMGTYLMVFSLANMLLGSIKALKQKNLRRFLAYSSISQTGYLMFILGIGYSYGLTEAFTTSLFMFFAIAVMKTLAFISTGVYEYTLGTDEIDRIRGVNKHAPLATFCFSVSLAGLAGIPLLAGFTGKWMVFSAALAAKDLFALICLVVFLISSVIGLGGYLPMLVNQYQKGKRSHPEKMIFQTQTPISAWMSLPLLILSLLVITLGVFPGPLLSLLGRFSLWMGP